MGCACVCDFPRFQPARSAGADSRSVIRISFEVFVVFADLRVLPSARLIRYKWASFELQVLS
jgi:hypothetical protein